MADRVGPDVGRSGNESRFATDPGRRREPRCSYHEPELISYGSLRELTRLGEVGADDGFIGSGDAS